MAHRQQKLCSLWLTYNGYTYYGYTYYGYTYQAPKAQFRKVSTLSGMVDQPWLIGTSLWKPRKAYADSCAFTDTPAVFTRGECIASM